MVMQTAVHFSVAGLNPSRANIAAAPPVPADWQGFEPPTQKICSRLCYHSTVVFCGSAAHPHCLEPSDHIYGALG